MIHRVVRSPGGGIVVSDLHNRVGNDPVIARANEPAPIVLETERIAREVTIGFVTFCRPQIAVRLVKSIRERYPNVRIVCVDNGDEAPDFSGFKDVVLVRLPFDSGLSASRNAIIGHLETPFLFLSDDDAVFTNETDIGPALSVMDAEPTVGWVGVGLWEKRSTDVAPYMGLWAQRLTKVGDSLIGQPIDWNIHRTTKGVRYVFADTALNHGLVRRDMLIEHRWRPELKLSEHWGYFWDVLQAGKWKTAVTPDVSSLHDRVRTSHYSKFRCRQAEFNPLSQQTYGFTSVRMLPINHPMMQFSSGQSIRSDFSRPNIILMGVGNSGTTVTARMLDRMGWNLGDADVEYSESVLARRINDDLNKFGQWDEAAAKSLLESLTTPWVIKDPRFCLTLNNWLPLLGYGTFLLWIDRDKESTIRSRIRRGATQSEAVRSVDRRQSLAAKHYESWPWGKLKISLEQIQSAISLFDVNRPNR